MADTVRTRSELTSIFADNTTGAITAQDLRDLVKSVNVLEEKNANNGYAGLDSSGKLSASVFRNNVGATDAPTAFNDSSQGYVVGSTWIFGSRQWFCADNSIGTAVWKETTVEFNGGNVTNAISVNSSAVITTATLPANMSGATLTSVPNVNGSPMLTTATGLRYFGGNTAGTLSVTSITPSNFDYTVSAHTQVAGSRSTKMLTGYAPDWTTLTQIDLRNNGLTYLPDVTGMRNLINIDLRDNSADPTALNLLLARLVINGATNGVLNIAGQSTLAEPSGQGLTDITTLQSRGWTTTYGLLLPGARPGFVGCSFTAEMADGSANSGYYAYGKQLITNSGGLLGGWKLYATQGYGSAEILATHIPAAVADTANVDFYILDGGYFNNLSDSALHPLTTDQCKTNVLACITALRATGKPVVLLEPFPSDSTNGHYGLQSSRDKYIEMRDWVHAQAGTQTGLLVTTTISAALSAGSSNPAYYNPALTRDGVHGNTNGYGLIGNKLWHDTLKTRMRTSSNYYVPTGAENILNPTFTGTTGTVGTGITGTVPTNWECYRASGGATAVVAGTSGGMTFAISGNVISGTLGTAAYPTFDSQIRIRVPSAAQRNIDPSLAPGHTVMIICEIDNLSGLGSVNPSVGFYTSGGSIISSTFDKLEANPTAHNTDWRLSMYSCDTGTTGKQRIVAFGVVPALAAKISYSVSLLGNLSGTLTLLSMKKV